MFLCSASMFDLVKTIRAEAVTAKNKNSRKRNFFTKNEHKNISKKTGNKSYLTRVNIFLIDGASQEKFGLKKVIANNMVK